MRTAVIILNWNTQAYLRRFLPPLIRSLEGLDAEVVVADNASGDGSRELLSEEFPGVRTILFDENLGFTGGYDRAVGGRKDWQPAPATLRVEYAGKWTDGFAADYDGVYLVREVVKIGKR